MVHICLGMGKDFSSPTGSSPRGVGDWEGVVNSVNIAGI